MMDLIRFVKPEFVHSDDRGSLAQLVSQGWRQVNVIQSAKGSVRGGHYHKNNQELFYIISGAFRLILDQGNEHAEYSITTGMMFIIPEQVAHTFEYAEDSILVACYDRGVNDFHGQDIHKSEQQGMTP
jgi:dTDP-4-dehydrorhamnose 3,5-epimerase-like enzyme